MKGTIDHQVVICMARAISQNGETFEEVAKRYEGALSQIQNQDLLKRLVEEEVRKSHQFKSS